MAPFAFGDSDVSLSGARLSAIPQCEGVYPANGSGAWPFAAPLDPDDQGARGVLYEFDLSEPVADTGATVSSADVVSVSGGLTIQDVTVGGGGTIVQFWAMVAAAQAGQDEHVRLTYTDTAGMPGTRTGIIRVRER